MIRNFHFVADGDEPAECVAKCWISQPVAQPSSPRFTIETRVARTSSELPRAAAQQRHAGMQAGAGIAAAVGVGTSAGAATSRVGVGGIAFMEDIKQMLALSRNVITLAWFRLKLAASSRASDLELLDQERLHFLDGQRRSRRVLLAQL